MEHGCICNDGIICLWCHSYGSTVYKNCTVCNRCTKDFRIGEIMKCNFAVCTFIKFDNDVFCSFKEGISYVKYIDLSNSIQCSLYKDCCCSSTSSQKSHFLSNDIHTVFFYCAHKSHTVCSVRCQYPIIINNGITCSGNLRCR